MNSSIKIVNGNYVIHFLQLLTPEQKTYKAYEGQGYHVAIANAKPLGGRKFHNKHFGGGIAFEYHEQAEKALAEFGSVWVYTIDHPEETVEWRGEMALADSRKLQRKYRTVFTYINEETYNQMKADVSQATA